MELPKSASELAIWLGMQFPVLASAILLAYWAVRYTERLYERRLDDSQRLNDRLLAEKDKQLNERGGRIAQLEAEVAELRAKMSRSKKPPDEPKPGGGGST